MYAWRPKSNQCTGKKINQSSLSRNFIMTDEELRVVGVGSSVSHGQDSPCLVLQGKVLILKLLAVDRFPTSSIMVDEVSSTRRYHSDTTN